MYVMMVAVVALLSAACGRMLPGVTLSPPLTALVGGRVQVSPDLDAIADGIVLIERDTITAIGLRASARIPSGATVIDSTGATVVAPFRTTPKRCGAGSKAERSLVRGS